MNALIKTKLSIMIISLLAVSGCSSAYATGEQKLSSDKQKSVKKIVQASNKFDENSIKASIPDAEVMKLREGRYAIISNKLSEDEIQKRLSKLKGIKKIEKPKNIGIVKPIGKVPVKNNFNVSNSVTNKDKILNDPGYKSQWDISYTESNKAWKLINQKKQIKVAVLDTGVDYKHVDLKNRVLKDLGYDFINNDSNPIDDNSHGTHVAGIIAAEANNKEGIAGIVGKLDVKIIPIKVLDANGQGQADIIAKGIEYAADKGADIINLSFGCSEKSIDIQNAIQYARNKGVFIVVAAGNDNKNCDSTSPAGDVGVYTVSAINTQLKKAQFSDYGNSIKIASPGVKILSTVPDGKYEVWDGTSMAAPVVSGIVAMLKAEKPNLTPNEIENILNKSAVDIMTKGKDNLTGYGLVDAYRAMGMVKSMKK